MVEDQILTRAKFELMQLHVRRGTAFSPLSLCFLINHLAVIELRGEPRNLLRFRAQLG
jgi:hypothetical protein